MYPSVSQLLVAALQERFPNARACTELPADVEDALPAIQVNRTGGGATVITMDRAYVDIDVWAATLAEADVLAAQVRTWAALELPGTRVVAPSGAGVFAMVHEQTGAMQRPSGSADLARVGMVLTIKVHSA